MRTQPIWMDVKTVPLFGKSIAELPKGQGVEVGRVWPNSWTEVKARTLCEKVFQESRSVQVCKNVKGVDISGSIENCILDIQLTGTTDFFRFSVDTVRDKCLHEVLVDPALWVKSGENNTSAYDIVVAEACLNDCSGKGTCTSGACICQPNYGGSDCSVDLTTPPRLADSDTVETCDMSRDACGVVPVKGETFIEGVSRCLVEEIRVRKSGQDIVGSNVHMATVVDIGHAQCKIATYDNTELEDVECLRTYRISVSNNACSYGSSVGLIVFNSTCMLTNGGRETKLNRRVKVY
ncbi:von Willebrand factor D and EGF domain-containing protein-like [Haliotis rufescens]|uniref:von Willebrand factor D and EGF domain-containing protein-like n=1 Tax=Haliotis rufescens TaxID=6454 RepID=UPI00201F691D|nr:von Willebrand factor D and EGF domain-containing protein-like [Haliotis rufescens]